MIEQQKEAPKPLSCKIENGVKRTVFNSEELRRFVESTDAASFVVEDESGNESVILVQPILESFSKTTKGKSRQ